MKRENDGGSSWISATRPRSDRRTKRPFGSPIIEFYTDLAIGTAIAVDAADAALTLDDAADRAHPEPLAIMLRNLVENAVTYAASPAPLVSR